MQRKVFPFGLNLTIVLALTALLLSSLPFTVAAQDMMDDRVHISIRHYDGIDPANNAKLERITREGFVPIISGSDGFIAYYVVYPTDGTGVTISIFETHEQASASNEQARDFVVEHLAPLLPNPPQIVEGELNIGFVEMLHGMADGAVGALHASVRIYDGFEADELDEFVTIVEDGFLPIMRGTDGFFGYYLMNDGADQVSAVSIFNSEATAMASNEAARAFVAENLTRFLPNAPSTTAGRVGIAVLADVHEGENLIDDRVFASIRIYEGLDPDDDGGLFQGTAEEFLDVIRDDDGFIAYYWLNLSHKVVAISLFETEAQASASNEAAREYIAENLADIVPGPPTVVEGAVEIGFVDMMNGMADGAVDSLYVSLRLYDGFESGDLDEFVAIVEGGFLPIMRRTDGFFGYYLMTDGADQVAAISIFDSEAAALASNAAAADFVAENLTQYLPNDPVIASGQLGIASFAAVNEGVNLIDHSMTDEVFASIRIYEGVNPNDMDTVVQLTAEGFLPIMRGSDGFVAYFLLPEGDTLAAISVFETAEQASASNEQARGFVAENLAPFLPNAPTIVRGPMDTRNFAWHDSMMMVDDAISLYASLRVYDEVDLTQRAQTTALVNSIFLPLQQETEGFWGYVRMHDGESRSAALSIYDSEANALAANDLAAAFVAEYLTDRPEDQVPLRVSGRLGVAALAEINEGANLIDERAVASIRVYAGVDPANRDEIVRLVDEGFLPIMRESDGFVGYYLLPAGDVLASVSMFDSAEQAAASNEAARDFVAEFMAPLLPNAPLIVEAAIDISYIAMREQMMDDSHLPLYASVRIYEVADMSNLEKSIGLVEAHLLPALDDAGGLFSYYSLSDGDDNIVGLNVYESESNALAANEIAAAFVAEHMTDWLPPDPLRVTGPLGVASLASIDMGNNQAAWDMTGG